MSEEKKDNVIQFPQVVKIATLWNEGLFGLTIEKITRVTQYETSIHIWFSEEKSEDDPWDLTLEYPDVNTCSRYYEGLVNEMRKLRFKVVVDK